MELKDICIDLEYAKKLKELGVKQDSLFAFKNTFENSDRYTDPFNEINIVEKSNYNKKVNWVGSAFTSTELLELLPLYCDGIGLQINKHRNKYNAYYENPVIEDKKLCNALAEMLIYLIENKLIEVKK